MAIEDSQLDEVGRLNDELRRRRAENDRLAKANGRLCAEVNQEAAEIEELRSLVKLMSDELDYAAEALPEIAGSARFGAVRADVRERMAAIGLGG